MQITIFSKLLWFDGHFCLKKSTKRGSVDVNLWKKGHLVTTNAKKRGTGPWHIPVIWSVLPSPCRGHARNSILICCWDEIKLYNYRIEQGIARQIITDYKPKVSRAINLAKKWKQRSASMESAISYGEDDLIVTAQHDMIANSLYTC